MTPTPTPDAAPEGLTLDVMAERPDRLDCTYGALRRWTRTR